MLGSRTLPWDLAWLFSELLTTLGFLLALVLLAHNLRQRRSPSSTIAWLLVILLLPYVGVPLYLMFGGRKTQRMTGKKEPVYQPPRCIPRGTLGGTAERILRSYGVPPATAGNAVALVPTGEDAFRQFVGLVDGAEHTIHITSYILGRDPVGALIVDRLARRASEGVAVRLLLDDIGSWWTGRRFLAPLREAGAEVAYFMPMFRLPVRGRANLRNHRKIVVADGRRAMVGGMNLAQHYMGPTPDPKRWRDLAAVVEGPAVRDLEDLFFSDWKFATGADLPRDEDPAPAAAPTPDTLVEVVASGPDVTGDPLYEALISALFSATERIWVVTPYFVPDETLVRALELAARRGVDVRLVVPRCSNHLAADLARGSYLRQVHDAGGKVLQYGPVMLHAKLIIIDHDLAVIGSANMDIRSLFLNYEVALFLYSRSQAAACSAWVKALMAECQSGLSPRGWAREMAENIARLLSPLL